MAKSCPAKRQDERVCGPEHVVSMNTLWKLNPIRDVTGVYPAHNGHHRRQNTKR